MSESSESTPRQPPARQGAAAGATGSQSAACDLVAQALECVERDGPAGLEALLAAHPAEADVVRRRVTALASLGLVDSQRSFGPYRILRTLGRGGMGVVYLARDERIQRLVALKALPESLVPNERARLRLQREIRAVAQLRHPAIVPIFDVGEEGGAPYFTMEWVEGSTLAEMLAAARARGLPPGGLAAADLRAGAASRSWIEAACRLVQAVAEGLAHAHALGVVHRDVKPQNVMVDAEGRARLFDFGLARLSGEAGLTATGDLAGTPYYLSPEAVEARHAALDARTDVYSLGVTLYELLTLKVPFGGTTTEEVLAQIALHEPPLPRRHNPEVSRDLETICLTAMEKDPERRYASAAAMAEDLSRLLSFRPVQARPVGPARRLLRLARRRKALAAALLLGAILLVGAPLGLVLANQAIAAERDAAREAATQARDAAARAEEQSALAQAATELAQAESQRATQEAAAAEDARGLAEQARAAADRAAVAAEAALAGRSRAVDFLLGLLTPANPQEVDHDLTVLELLQRGAAGVGPALAGEPRLQASVRQALGNAFLGLGEYGGAEAQYNAAFDLVAGQDAGSMDDSLAVSLGNLVIVHASTGSYARAAELGERALAVNTKVFGEASLAVADVKSNLAIVADRSGDGPRAEALFREVLALRESLLGPDHSLVAETAYNLGLSLSVERDAEREQLFARALAIQRVALPEDDPVLATTLGGVAELYHHRGDSARAIALQEEGLAILVRRLGERHPDTATASVRLAFMHIHVAEFAAAEPHLRRAVEGYGKAFPQGHGRRVTALKWLATVLAALERPLEAEPVLAQALDEQGRVAPQDSVERQALLTMRADLLERLGRAEDLAAFLAAHPEVSWPPAGGTAP